MAESLLDTSPLFNVIIIDLYKEAAQRAGLHEADISSIFSIPTTNPTMLEALPTQLDFYLQDQYDTAFDCPMGGNAMLLFAESQRNKTTSLLTIATLLGYSWDDPHNVHFLSDEEFVKKGRSRRDLLIQGCEARLHVKKGSHILSVEAKAGGVTVTSHVADAHDTKTFDLRRNWSLYEKYMNRLTDVQLVSKGRSFIEKVEQDILNDLRQVAQILSQNSRKESDRLSARRPHQIESANQRSNDAKFLSREIEKVKNELRENENQRKKYMRQLAALGHIASLRSQLKDDDFRAIEKLFRLESDLKAAEDTEREKLAHQENLQRKEREIQQLRQAYQGLSDQKEVIDSALRVLLDDVTALLSNSSIMRTGEIENLLVSIEASDIQSICSTLDEELTPESLIVYRSLIQVLEGYDSPSIGLLPLGGGIKSSRVLLQQLRSDLEKATALVYIYEAITKFTQSLSGANISQGMTAMNYRDLVNQISSYKRELDLLEADLAVDQEISTARIGERDVTLLKAQIKEAKEALSPTARETREAIEEEVKSLEELADVQIERVWSSNAISYLQELERRVDDILRGLRREQIRLEREKEEHEMALASINTGPLPVNEAYERATRINGFMETLNYIDIFARTLTSEQREQHNFQFAIRYLEEIGLAQLLKATVDRLITDRCKYYYENSVSGCVQRPLDAVLYMQRNRSTSLFRMGDVELSRVDLSGGTESVMTVRSLVSRPSAKSFGTVLLVDEWGDVEQIGEPLYQELGQMSNLLIAIFVKVEDSVSKLSVRTLN